ncbi:hypothetical protein ROZALSC1DRAFT_22958 [Rozella allomycis CSF55]|uniref:Uncharacterized protein n=1 Tax=Rozella allomycis (strain CSF55) TaxID=988480 RepID=A0A4P9YGR0_ROZAC|nr:hypothetical protein ROZALSC1DRAFT_22958 [Rozella allomycis CSF55]
MSEKQSSITWTTDAVKLVFVDKTQARKDYRKPKSDVNHTGNMIDPCYPAYGEAFNSYHQSRSGISGNILADSAAVMNASKKTEYCKTEAHLKLMSTPRKEKSGTRNACIFISIWIKLNIRGND